MGYHRSWDSFMINEYTIRMYEHMRDCPFVYAGDPARIRDPNRHAYSSQRCPDFLNGCPRGDACPFAHGYFESWFHPENFRVHIYYPDFHTYEEDPSRLILNQPATFPHHNFVLQGYSSSVAAYANQWPRFGDNFAQGSSSSVLYRNLQPGIFYGHEFPAFQSPPMIQPPNSQTSSRPPSPPPPPVMQQPSSQTSSSIPPPPPPPPPSTNMMQQPQPLPLPMMQLPNLQILSLLPPPQSMMQLLNSQTSLWPPLSPPMMPLPNLQIPSLLPPPPSMMQLPNSHIPSMLPSPSMMQQPYSQTPSMPPRTPPPLPVMQPSNSQTRMIVGREDRPQIPQFGIVRPQPRLDPIARPPRATIRVQHQSVLAPFPTDLSRAISHLQADAASLKEARSKKKHDDEAGSSNK